MNPPATTQTAREFMEAYLCEQEDFLEWDLLARDAFEEKFYSAEVMNRHRSLRANTVPLNRRALLALAAYTDSSQVTLTNTPDGKKGIMRYLLRLAGGRWQIYQTEGRCNRCDGAGVHAAKNCCTECQGTGWKNYAQERYIQKGTIKK
jgi:hypothetical protein